MTAKRRDTDAARGRAVVAIGRSSSAIPRVDAVSRETLSCPSRLRVVTLRRVKGWDGTAYCSSENSSVAHASARVERSFNPELFQEPGHPEEHSPVELKAPEEAAFEQEAVDAGIAGGVGVWASFAESDFLCELECQR